MPAIRNTVASVSQVSKVQILSLKNSGRPAQTTPTAEADSDASSLKAIDYPARDSLARATFIGENGKSVPSHHWAVYDFTFTIPSGKIMTYKASCQFALSPHM
ncbi:hypothetical protein FRB94_003729 [Tulasnella sp. JGI-2019a]|nr:hypothetical protein FRB93_013409 [Tulasnella sp. JGI-2019a]KAG9002636.1 hypothetical protein FRB94_003729 [Tulasnella sp. JGI-2019a]